MATSTKSDDMEPHVLQIVLWYLLLVPVTIISLPIFIIWRLVAVMLINMQYDNPKFLTSFDVLFKGSEDFKENVVAFCMEFKGKLDCDKMKQLLSDELASRYVRYRSYIVEKYNHFFWLENKNFSIDNHFLFHSEVIKTQKKLKEVVHESVAIPFSPKTPPWFFDVYALDPKYDGGKGDETFFCLIFRFHHALGDGYSLQHVLFKALCGESDLDLSTVESGQRRLSILQQLGSWLQLLLLFPYVVGEMVFTNINVYGNQRESKRIDIQSNALNVDTVKKIKRTLNVPFSRVLMSCCSAGLQKHMTRAGIALPRKLEIIFTHRLWEVNETVEPQNKFVSLIFRVSFGSETAKERLQQLHRSMQSPLNSVRGKMFTLLGSRGAILLPSCVIRKLFNITSPAMAMSTHVERDNKLVITDNGSVLVRQSYMIGYPKTTRFAFVWHTIGNEVTLSVYTEENMLSDEERKALLKDVEYELTLLDKEIR